MSGNKAKLSDSLKKNVAPKNFKKNPIKGTKFTIMVSSAKGGVGKSTIAVNLAFALQKLGLKIGILDADVFGPSLPKLLNLQEKPKSEDNKSITPLEKFGAQCMSMGLLIDEQTPMMWRGPMVISAIKTMTQKVLWKDRDVIIIDMPPGTGDAYLTILNDLDINDVVLVAVEDDFCIADLHKTNSLIKKFKKNCLGIIENMSENFDINDDPVLSKRIKDEFNLEILFTLPRIPRKDFYEELVNLDKLKKYIPKKMFK